MDSIIQPGQNVPDFELPDLQGVHRDLSELRGKWVVLNFWSAECPWSQRADQQLAELLPQWGEQVVYWMIASNANEAEEEIKSAAAGLPGHVLRDAEHAVADQYSAETTPHFYVIDPQGILRYRGALDDVTFRKREPEVFYLKEAMEALLAGKVPSVETSPGYGCTIVRFAM
jgi:peroxiredoxin